jgi:hypothetical protein
MDKSQPDGTHPLPETAEIGGEGGSFGESTSRESRRERGHVRRVDQDVDDRTGNVTRMPELAPDASQPDEIVKHPTEP